MIAWLSLFAAGALEVIWAVALRGSEGFTKPLPALLAVISAGLSLLLLSIALRTLPLSLAYVVWVGIGAAGVTIYGIFVLSEASSPLKFISIAMIATGTAALALFNE